MEGLMNNVNVCDNFDNNAGFMVRLADMGMKVILSLTVLICFIFIVLITPIGIISVLIYKRENNNGGDKCQIM